MASSTCSASSTRRQNGTMTLQIGQPHVVAHAAQRGAFERKSIRIGGMRIARGATEAEHRVLFHRLERARRRAGCAYSLVLKSDRRTMTGLRIERRGDEANAFR